MIENIVFDYISEYNASTTTCFAILAGERALHYITRSGAPPSNALIDIRFSGSGPDLKIRFLKGLVKTINESGLNVQCKRDNKSLVIGKFVRILDYHLSAGFPKITFVTRDSSSPLLYYLDQQSFTWDCIMAYNNELVEYVGILSRFLDAFIYRE